MKKILHNKTLERDQAYCAAFSGVPGSGKFNFLSEVLGFKSLAPQLPVKCLNEGFENKLRILSLYYKEFLSGILGALLSAVVILSTGIYTMNRQFEIAHLYELRADLKRSIDYLKFADHEIDMNISLLLQTPITPEIGFERFIIKKIETKDEKFNEFLNGFINFSSSIMQLEDSFIIKRSIISYEQFQLDATENIINASYIDFDLRQELLQLYNRLSQINKLLNELRNDAKKGSIVNIHTAQKLKEIIDQIEIELGTIQKDQLLEMKNRLKNELKIIEQRYNSIDKNITLNKTLERDQAYCAVFREPLVQ